MARLPAEWEKQDAVLLAWPHEQTDWYDILDDVEPVFLEIVKQISLRQKAVVLVQDELVVRKRLMEAGARMEAILISPMAINDTWARDFGPIIIESDNTQEILDFGFNGWGSNLHPIWTMQLRET